MSGDDLYLSAGGGGVVVKNWYANQSRVSVTLPNGQVLSANALNALLPPLSGWAYAGGMFAGSASNFSDVVTSLYGLFSPAASYWASQTGQSLYADAWTANLGHGYATNKQQEGHTIYSASLDFVVAVSDGYAHDPYDPYSHVRTAVSYDYWQTDSGAYEFAITSQYSGYGGQLVSRWVPSTEQWVYTRVPNVDGYSRGYNVTAHLYAPETGETAVLYSPAGTAGLRSSDLDFFSTSLVSTNDLEFSRVPSLSEFDGAVTVEAHEEGGSTPQAALEHAWSYFGDPAAKRLEILGGALTEVGVAGKADEDVRVTVMPVPTNEFRLVA